METHLSIRTTNGENLICNKKISHFQTTNFAHCQFFPDAASKHAFQAFCDTLRAEVSSDNIHVCVVSPGYIQTNLSQNAVCGDGSTYNSKKL